MPAAEEEIRNAAETVVHTGYNQSFLSPQLDISHSQSINTLPSVHTDYIVSEDLLSGQRLDGSMSNVRRFFCLFVTFDLLFTSLMWLICVMLTGENISTALSEQIYHYNVHTSLFDIVLAALCRFTVLLLFYALLYVNHWFIISISTTVTCAFLIGKVFVYDWPSSQQPVFEVLLVLTSFVLSWGEAWFLDFRVLPQESHARRYLITSPDSERAPLVRSYVHGLPSMYTESVGNFYSPLASPSGSLYRVDPGRNGCYSYPAARFTKEQEETYKEMGRKSLQEAWKMVHHPDWKLEKQISEEDAVHTMSFPKVGKLYKLSAVIDVSAQYLLEELFYKVDSLAQWNPTVLESHKIQPLDEHTDITYQVSAESGSGMISSRDFVTLRHWSYIDGCYVIAFSATDHPSIPRNEKYIRGENGVGCMLIRPIPGEHTRCQFQWLFNTNLKGWIPQYVIDGATVGILADYIKCLRQHITKLRETGRLT